MKLPTTTKRGYCFCGCGEKTSLATRAFISRGIRKGEPMFFVNYHAKRVSGSIKWPDVDRIRELADKHSQHELARMFNTNRRTVQRIVTRKAWIK